MNERIMRDDETTNAHDVCLMKRPGNTTLAVSRSQLNHMFTGLEKKVVVRSIIWGRGSAISLFGPA